MNLLCPIIIPTSIIDSILEDFIKAYTGYDTNVRAVLLKIIEQEL